MGNYARIAATLALMISGASASFSIQPATQSPESQATILLTKLSAPIYPPLARMTRISGDVKLLLSVRPDGSVDSAEVLTGHPLLKFAALDSAQHSQFECRKCETTTSYQIIYTFVLEPTGCCAATDSSGNQEQGGSFPRVDQSQNHVTIVDKPACICDPAGEIRKVRSWKCLYLWRCSSR